VTARLCSVAVGTIVEIAWWAAGIDRPPDRVNYIQTCVEGRRWAVVVRLFKLSMIQLPAASKNGDCVGCPVLALSGSWMRLG
jgi:hypothetical protein